MEAVEAQLFELSWGRKQAFKDLTRKLVDVCGRDGQAQAALNAGGRLEVVLPQATVAAARAADPARTDVATALGAAARLAAATAVVDRALAPIHTSYYYYCYR